MKTNVPLGLALVGLAGALHLASGANEPSAAIGQSGPKSIRPVERQVPTRTIAMLVTAYDAGCEICCGRWAGPRKTSIGDDATLCDGVAADPKLLPYRTRLAIPGVGIREVDDTGGAMRQDGRRGVYHIDVRMATHAEALRWGVKRLNVAVVDAKTKTALPN